MTYHEGTVKGVKMNEMTRKKLNFLNVGRAMMGIKLIDELPVQRDGESDDYFYHRMFMADPESARTVICSQGRGETEVWEYDAGAVKFKFYQDNGSRKFYGQRIAAGAVAEMGHDEVVETLTAFNICLDV